MNVIDTVAAESVEVGDLIDVDGDIVEVTDVSDDMENVHLRGVSLVEGDKVSHIVSFTALVDLLGA